MDRSGIEPNEIAASLGALERRLRGAAPADVVGSVRSIGSAVAALMPRVRNATSPRMLLVVATAALLDTPQAVNAYLALPPAVRVAAAVTEDRMPAALLRERLERIDATLGAVLDTTYAPGLARLVANGRFLRARFAIV